MNGKEWQPYELEYLKARYPVTLTEIVAVSLGRNIGSIYSAALIHGIKKSEEFKKGDLSGQKNIFVEAGKANRFKKGQTPMNKGKKWSEFMSKEGMRNSRKTTFKKGTIPPNLKPVGYERISKDGYVEVKTGEGMRMFRLKHRIIYEQIHGKIPKGYNVMFADGNRQNFNPENLVLRTRAESMKLNSFHNYPKEVANTIQLLGALHRQINKRKSA